MSDALPADAAGPQVPTPTLTIAFDGFLELHGRAYFEYAHAHLDDTDLATDLVDDVFAALADRWDWIIQQPSPAAYAWAMLRHVVEAECERRDEHRVLVEKAAFGWAHVQEMRRDGGEFLDDLHASVADFGELANGLTLATAIRKLSGSKHDVMVLRYLNGLTVTETAELMGIEEATVRSLTTQARARVELHLAPRRLLRPGPTQNETQE
ncbi:sigma-70 family RNA polymerase sigma factor [Kitasatospora sp. NPDC085895]|uniref:sigma-70 family RNA polymerase sigma factor n=1 Tax=Kitasatospora sp. NPDC085895 TaxID=3155057 RepID=UPI00344B246C